MEHTSRTPVRSAADQRVGPAVSSLAPRAPVPLPSLEVGHADDPTEAEADAIAAVIVQRLAAGVSVVGPGDSAVEDAASDQPVRRSAAAGRAGGAVEGDTAASIDRLRGQGQALPGDVASTMGAAFGADLSHVRAHTGGESKRLNADLGAHAFTTGDDIFFGGSLPSLRDAKGQHLLAHELTHVLQHRQGGSLDALRRAARTPSGTSYVPRREERVAGPLVSGMLSAVADEAGADTGADADAGPVRRVFDLAINTSGSSGTGYTIANIVVSERPPNPSKVGMKEEGGKSFHHESAWTLITRSVTQYKGQKVADVAQHMAAHGISPTYGIKMPEAGIETMDQLQNLNAYFKAYLVHMAGVAEGWLGSKAGHSKQGGLIATALKKLKGAWTQENVVKVLAETFEPSPSMAADLRWWAAEAHADNFVQAHSVVIYDENPHAAIDEHLMHQIHDWVYDWTTQFWDESYED